ncbi:MAG: alpha/beta hydrolase-fold protein [Gemmatimonadota bacterium]
MPRWPHSLFRWKPRRKRFGTLNPMGTVVSPQLGNTREILVYLPYSYQRSRRRYSVIYMQDGQNLFDPRTSFAGDWGLLDGLTTLPRRTVEPIIVAISNAGEDRLSEYSPFVDAKGLGGQGDRYLDFVLDTVKPAIDQVFRTNAGRSGTGIAGSSMGGLISLYGFFRRPESFGFVASLSPSLWFADRAIFPFVESAPHVPGKVYLDIGTAEGAESLANARRMRALLLAKGYRDGLDFRWMEESGGDHTEAAWGRRFKAALPFLLTP